MPWRDVMEAGAMGVVDSGVDLMYHGKDEYDAAQEVLARKPVLTPSAVDYLAMRGLADVLREVRDEAAS